MRIVEGLNKAKLNIEGWSVSPNSSSEVLGFEDILSLILAEKNIQGGSFEVSSNYLVSLESPSEFQEQGKDASTVKKEQKERSLLDSSSFESLVAYWRLDQFPEVKDVKVDDGSKENPTISADHTSQNFFAKTYAIPGDISDKDYAEQSLNPVLIDEPTKANNLNTFPRDFGEGVEKSQKINNVENAKLEAKSEVRVERLIRESFISLEPEVIIKGEHTSTNSENELAYTLKKLHGFENSTQKINNKEQIYTLLQKEGFYTNAETNTARDAKLEAKSEVRVERLIRESFISLEPEVIIKGEHTSTNSETEAVYTVLKTTQNLPEDLSQKDAKFESLHVGKEKIKEEDPHFHGVEIPHQKFEHKVESVQEAKNTKPPHALHETKSLYVKLEEGEFRIRIIRDAISVRMDFREDFRPPTVQEVQSLIESLSKVGFRMEMLSLNGKNLQWEFRQWQEDRRGNKAREVSHLYGKERQEFNLYL